MSYDIYTGMLKMYDTFRPATAPTVLRCDFSAPELATLREQYDLPVIAGEGPTLPRALRVMEWLTSHVRHDGSFAFNKGHLALPTFAFAFDQKDKGVNCTTLSRTLASCLLSLGIPARPVGIYPFSPHDGDNHFVTEAWCAETAQWVMLDPTVNAHAMDAEGRPLSCLEIRAALADQQPIRFSEGLRYNGHPYDATEHRDYLAKDLFFLQFPAVSCYNTGESDWFFLCPEGYDCHKRDVLNIRWRMKQYGGEDNEWLAQVEKAVYQFTDPEAAYCPPAE